MKVERIHTPNLGPDATASKVVSKEKQTLGDDAVFFEPDHHRRRQEHQENLNPDQEHADRDDEHEPKQAAQESSLDLVV